MSVVRPSLDNRGVVVTGGTGFLGSALVRAAVAEGADVIVLSQATSDPWRLADVAGRYRSVAAPLEALDDVSLDLPPQSIMVHFAAVGVNQGTGTTRQLVQANVAGTASALQWAARHGVARFVLIGTSGEYGPGVGHEEDGPIRPNSEYGATRAAATLVARAFAARHGLDVVVVRPFAVFGPYEPLYRLLPHVIHRALRGVPIPISTGDQTRDYVYLEDVIEGITCAGTVAGATNGTFNLCSGVETSVRDAAILAASLVSAEAVGRIETGAVAPIPGEMGRTSGDPSRARRVLGWQPRHDLASGLTRTVAWCRDVGAGLPAYRPAAS